MWVRFSKLWYLVGLLVLRSLILRVPNQDPSFQVVRLVRGHPCGQRDVQRQAVNRDTCTREPGATLHPTPSTLNLKPYNPKP